MQLKKPRIPHAALVMLAVAWIAVVATMVLAWSFETGAHDTAASPDNEDEPTATSERDWPTALPKPDEDATLVVPHVHDDDEAGEGAVSASGASGSVEPVGDGTPLFTMPLRAFSHWTDRFGAARGGGFIHGGIDLAVEGLEGSKVYSACPGTVSTAEYSRSYGYYVVVDCGNAWATLYAHLSVINVEAGQAATSVTVLGLTGSSGFSTGEHLHFEIIYDGTRTNPENYLDFGIPPGTPLSNGPLWFPGSGETYEPPTPTPTITPTPTDTPIPTATMPASGNPTEVVIITPTPRPTSTATATPTPPIPTATPTPPIFVP
jgi:hypothetical protein